MSYNRTPLLDLVDAFEAYVGVVIAGMGTHVVVQDYNLDDANLARALAYLDDEREALLHDPYVTMTLDEWAKLRAFMVFLQAIPCVERNAHWHEPLDDCLPDAPAEE